MVWTNILATITLIYTIKKDKRKTAPLNPTSEKGSGNSESRGGYAHPAPILLSGYRENMKKSTAVWITCIAVLITTGWWLLDSWGIGLLAAAAILATAMLIQELKKKR